MSTLTAREKAAVKWLELRGVQVAEPMTLLTSRLSVRRGKRSPDAFTAAFFVYLLTFAGIFVYQFLLLILVDDHNDLPDGGLAFCIFGMVVLTTWLHVRAGDREAIARLGDRLDRPRPPWREVLGGWYLTTLAVTFGGGAVLGIVLAAGGSLWAWLWLSLLALGAIVDAVILTSVLRRPVIAEDEGSLAVDAVTRLEDVQLAMPSAFALPVVADLVFMDLPAKPWLIGYVVLAVATHVVARITQRRRIPALPADGYYGEAR
ncbi:hypothetical protein [Amycolatopsis sp. NPDC051371]|uniref:hypothetical protein n=1 Tax=Amycolatopsis sp. NPDC051371 TaxID=3155800 RepID=UPI003418E330